MEYIVSLIIFTIFLLATLLAPLWGAVGVTLFSCLESLTLASPVGDIRAAYCAAAGFLLAATIQFIRGRSSLQFELMVLLCAWIVTALFSSLLSASLMEALSTLLKWVLFAGTSLAIAQTLSSTINSQSTFSYVWVGCVVITVLLGGAQMFFQQESWRPSGGFLDWNYAILALAMILPLVWLSAQQAQTPTRANTLKGLVVAGLVMAMASRSRSGLLAIAIMLAAHYIMLTAHSILLAAHSASRNLDRKYIFAAITATIVGLIILLGGILAGGFTPSRILNSPAIQERIGNGLLAYHIFLESPFVGVGAGQFVTYATTLVQEIEFTVTGYHSTWLTLLAETGLFGGLAIAALMAYLALNAWRMRDNEEGHALFIVVLTLLTAATLQSIHVHMFTWCLIGYLASRLKQSESTLPTA